MTYDPQNLESVLMYVFQRFGTGIFRESNRIYAIICDLSPKLKPYADVIRRLSERGALAELEATRDNLTQRDRVVVKTRNTMENELLMSADRAEYLISVLCTLYGIAPPPVPNVKPISAPQPVRKAQPTPTSTKIVKRGDCGANVHYTLEENGVLTISGRGTMRDFVWDKETHTVDTPWWGETVSCAEIQNGVTTIGDFTFEGTELTSVTIPDSVKEIRICAFASCEALTSVTIPDSVKNIEEGAFSYCTSLTSVAIPNGLTTIRDGIFQDCAGLKSLNIPDSVTTIGEGSFSGCLGLKSLMIPDSVTTIGSEAFAECAGLRSLTIPDSVTTIGERAFAGCEGLASVSVPARVKIEADAFPDSVRVTRRSATPGKIIKRGDCGVNVRYTLDENGILTISGNGAIKDFVWNKALDTMETPWREEREAIVYAKVQRGVTRIGEGAFVDCTSMSSVDLPNGLTTIGPCAFAECAALTSVTIPNGVKNIEESAFCYCEGLTSVNFPDSLTRIGETAFEDCTSLKSVTIPDSVTTIGERAFAGCEGLASVSVPARVKIEADAFPDSVRVTRRSATPPPKTVRTPQPTPTSTAIIQRGECGDNVHYTLDANGILTISGNGSMRDFQINQQTNTCDAPWWNKTIIHVEIQNGVTSIGNFAFISRTLKSVTIPDSVTEIGLCAFLYCIELTNVTIPSKVTKIVRGLFYHCEALQSVTIPNSVTVIEENAFAECTALTSVTIPDSVMTIKASAFAGSALSSVTISGSVKEIGEYTFARCAALTSVTIPNSVTTIPKSAFMSCAALTSVTICNGVTTIEDVAFGDCTALTSVTIPDSVTSIGTGAFYRCPNLTAVSVPAKTTVKNAFPNSVRVTRRGVAPGKIVQRGECGANVRYTLDENGILTIFGTGSMRNFQFNEQTDTCNTPWWNKPIFHVEIQNGVTNIGSGAFIHCEELTSVTIPDSVTEIGLCAFADCKKLTNVTIPSKVKKIGKGAFCYCTELTSVTIPDSVMTIEESAFEDCAALTNVSVPAKATIGANAFSNSVHVTRRNPKKKGLLGWLSF